MPSSSTSSKAKLAPHSNGAQTRSFLYGQLFGTVPSLTSSQLAAQKLSNLTVIVTGANTGLGLEAAKQLVSLGCVGRLILACRSLERGEAAKCTLVGIQKSLAKGTAESKIEVWQLDMASLKSMRAFSERCETELDKIDSIVLNAGVHLYDWRLSSDEDGSYEMTIMVNVVGTFVLAALMTDVMREKSRRNESKRTNESGMVPPRITITGSAVQFFAKYDPLLEAAQSQEGIMRWLSNSKRWQGKIGEDRYYLSKGIVQMLVRQLGRRISEGEKKGKGMVVLNCVGPGYCRTDLFRDTETMGSRMALKLIGRDADVGARTLVIGALGENGGLQSHGGYMTEGVVKPSHSWAETEQGEKIGKMMWEEVLDVIRGVKSGVVEAL